MKVLIIGLGSIAKKHIQAMRRQIANVEIFALRTGDSATASDYPSVINVFSFNEVEFETIDFVIISSPTSKHFEGINICNQLKKPLFIEKPLFSEITNKTEQLVKDVILAQTKTYVACNLRFLDALKILKNLVQNKRINEVNVYCGSYLPDWRPNVDFRKVYSANKEMGGGVHIDLIHELDYVYWLFGKPVAHRSLHKSSSSLEISAIDYANFIWEYSTFTTSIVLNYYRRDAKRTIEIVTSEGTFLANLLENKIFYNGEVIFQSEQRISDTYDAQMKYFIDFITGSQTSFNTIEEANTILKLCIQD